MKETSERKSILIVDDDSCVRAIFSSLLEDEHDCVTAGSAEEALALISGREFDLVLCDIVMGGMSGLELVPAVLEVDPRAVLVMISGLQSIESAIEAMRVGAFDYIVKPPDLQHFRAAVGRALEHRSLLLAKHRHEAHLEQLVALRTAELGRALGTLEDAYRATLKALTSALETRDHETHGHSERVVRFSLRLGRQMNLTGEQMRSLEFGSLLHDIGKIGVPDAILRKPAQLTDGEWENMRRHPLLGQDILSGIEFLEGAARVVAQHHEKWDGSGYPARLKGEEIDLNARIFAVADAFDAITSDRVYRKGRSYTLAAEELSRCAGSHFDPAVIEAFLLVPAQDWEELRQGPAASAWPVAEASPAVSVTGGYGLLPLGGSSHARFNPPGVAQLI